VHFFHFAFPLAKADFEKNSDRVSGSVVAHEPAVVIKNVGLASSFGIVFALSRMTERHNFTYLVSAATKDNNLAAGSRVPFPSDVGLKLIKAG